MAAAIEHELDRYLKFSVPLQPEWVENPMLFWIQYKNDFPKLYAVARSNHRLFRVKFAI